MIKNIFLAAMAVPLLTTAFPAAADGDYRAQAIAVIKKDFQPRGQASLDRLAEDALQAVCNRSGNKPPKYIAEQMEADQLAGVIHQRQLANALLHHDVEGLRHVGTERVAQRRPHCPGLRDLCDPHARRRTEGQAAPASRYRKWRTRPSRR